MNIAMTGPPSEVSDERLGWMRGSLRWHVAALALVLVGLGLWVNNGEAGFTDEGVYSAQAALLADGSWSAPLPAVALDPGGDRVAITGSVVGEGRFIPYARHPIYPILLTPAYALGGFAAMMAISVLGTVVASLCGALIARRIDPLLAVPTLWLIGVGSPLLFDAYLVVAHSLTAAAAAALALLTLRGFDDAPPKWLWAAVAPVAVLLTMLRSEGVLVAAALAVAVGVMSLSRRPPRIDWRRVVIAGSIGVSAVVAYIADSRLADSITGVAESGSGSVHRNPDALSSAWISLVRPWHGDATGARTSAILMFVGVLLGAVVLRLLPRYRFAGVALLLLAAASGVVRAIEQPDLISGLFAAFPLLFLGFVGLWARDLRSPTIRLLLGVSALTTVALLFTIYREGGATEWGGRFFHVLIPLVTPVAVVGLHHLFGGGSLTERRLAWGAVAVLTAALSVSALRANVEYRRAAASIIEHVERFADSAGREDDLVIVSTLTPSGSARIFWRSAISNEPILSTLGMGDLHGALDTAAEAGHDQVIVMSDVAPDMLSYLLATTLDELEWGVISSENIPNTTMRIALVGAE